MPQVTLSPGKTVPDGLKVRVYYNRHRRCFSIQSKETGTWRLYAYVERLSLRNARCVVSATAARRIRSGASRHPHAFVEGDALSNPPAVQYREIRYCPYEGDNFFYLDSGEPCLMADFYRQVLSTEQKPRIFAGVFAPTQTDSVIPSEK